MEQILAKLGIFLLVHVIPSAVRVACLLYDVTNRDEWRTRHNCPACHDVTTASGHYDVTNAMQTEVFMTETAMSTLTGLVSGVFVMTSYLSDVTSHRHGGVEAVAGRRVDDVIIDCRVSSQPRNDRLVEGNNRIRYDPIGKRRELHELIL